MAFLFAFLILVPLVLAQRSAENNPHWFFNSSGPACCECVPYYHCKDGQLSKPVQGESKTDVLKCESEVEFCCRIPNAPKNCSSFQSVPKVNTDPQPKKTCECVPWETCAPEKVVTDGKGAHSDLGLTTHSKCSDKLNVCCHQSNDHGTTGLQVSVRAGPPQEETCLCVAEPQCVDGMHNVDGVGILQPRIRAEKTCPNGGDVWCCGTQQIDSGNMRIGNYLILTGFATFISLTVI